MSDATLSWTAQHLENVIIASTTTTIVLAIAFRMFLSQRRERSKRRNNGVGSDSKQAQNGSAGVNKRSGKTRQKQNGIRKVDGDELVEADADAAALAEPVTPAAAAAASSTTIVSAPAPAAETTAVIDGIQYRVCGRIAISDRLLGTGGHGTRVLAGLCDRRPAAVKCMLKAFHPAALREISLLIRIDSHPNVVRYYACEEADQFVSILYVN
jgi:serine/threonine protein kinase